MRPETLDRPVCAPSRFKQEVDTALLILDVKTGVIAAPGAASVGEHEDALGSGHECTGLGKVGARRAAFEALLTGAVANQTFAAPGYFGDRRDAVVLKQGIKRGRDRRHGADIFEQFVAFRLGLRIDDGVAGVVIHRA